MKRFQYYLPKTIQSFFFIFFLPLYKVFVHLEIHGKENLKNISGPIILASNHTGEFDPTIIPLITKFWSSQLPIYSVIYPLYKYNDPDYGWRRYLYKGWFFSILGGYPVYSGYKDYARSLANHIALLKQGKTVCIFPEGRYTLNGKIGPGRGGMGYLAYQTNATIVPLVIDTFFGLSLKDFLLRKQKISITVLSPMRKEDVISTSNPTVEDFRKASQIVLDRINNYIAETK